MQHTLLLLETLQFYSLSFSSIPRSISHAPPCSYRSQHEMGSTVLSTSLLRSKTRSSCWQQIHAGPNRSLLNKLHLLPLARVSKPIGSRVTQCPKDQMILMIHSWWSVDEEFPHFSFITLVLSVSSGGFPVVGSEEQTMCSRSSRFSVLLSFPLYFHLSNLCSQQDRAVIKHTCDELQTAPSSGPTSGTTPFARLSGTPLNRKETPIDLSSGSARNSC